jgi:hypothetical protein
MARENDRRFTNSEEQLFDKLEAVINKTVEQVCEKQIPAGTEEPALSSRIAQAIETELQHHSVEVDGMRVEVATQDVPSHGPNTLERKTGVDLYVSVIRHDDDEVVSKGILVQSKRGGSLRQDHRRLRNQSTRMRTRSEESYVIIFDEDNAVAVPAKRSCYPKLPHDFRHDEISIGELIVDGLRCSRGDENIGRNPELPRPRSMSDIM